MAGRSLDLSDKRYTLLGYNKFEAEGSKQDFLFTFDNGNDLKTQLERHEHIKYDTYEVIDFVWRSITDYSYLEEVACSFNAADAQIKYKNRDSVSEKQKLHSRINELEEAIFSIANIDTIFMNNDGTDRPFNEKEALERIDEVVVPIWNKHCEDLRKEVDSVDKDNDFDSMPPQTAFQ